MNKYHEEQFNNIKAYIERIERDNKFLLNEIERLDERIDKAIEYIEKEFEEVGCCVSGSDLPYSYIEELLDILKGSDTNE